VLAELESQLDRMAFANELYFLKDILTGEDKLKLLDQVIFQWRHVNVP
jgi:hypothetical protein